MLTVPLLAIMLTSAVVKTVLEPSSDARLTAIARSVHDWTAGWVFIAVLVAAFGLSALLLARANQ